MAIPLPGENVVFSPGGPLLRSMSGANAFAGDVAKRKILEAQARYAPLTALANASSKLAFSQLMGPQYLAKLMGNQDILANMSEDQKRNAIDLVYKAGTSSPTNIFSAAPSTSPNPSNAFSNSVENVRQAMGFNKPTVSQDQTSNILSSPALSQEDKDSINAMQPGESYVIKGNQDSASPVANQFSPAANQRPTFAENVGSYKGVVSEGEEAGKIRANNLNDLASDYESTLNTGYTINELEKITTSPLFQNMRNKIPFFQKKQLEVLSKIGTPEEQKMIGDFITTSQNLVKDVITGFRGNMLKTEFNFADNMKVNPNDTFDTALGKLEAMDLFNELKKQRSMMTSQLMKDNHMDKQEALKMADKQLNGNAIRQQIHDKLNPTVTIRNKKTGETRQVPIDEARKLGVSNV